MKKSAKLHKANGVSANPYDGNPDLWSVVAFQDEITRSLNLSDPSLPKPKKHAPRTLPPLDRPSATSRNSPTHRSPSSSLPHSSPTTYHSPSSSSSSPPSQSRPSATSAPLSRSSPTRHSPSPAAPRAPASHAQSRASPVQSRASHAHPAHAGQSMSHKSINGTKPTEEDIVVEERKYNLTLAQKMGLTPAPPAPLSQAQWEEVKKISDIRHDSYMPCVICQDEFRMDGQVLLSCSHVFHKICLDSFEKYSKMKCCPLCRKEEYQKAQISEGKKVYLNKCATKIQSVYRGYCARKLFQHILNANPPENAERRKVFYARKLGRITDELLTRIEHDRAAIDSSINAMSHNVAASIAYLRSVGIGTMLNPNSINWAEINDQARERNTPDCPICIMPLVQHHPAKHLTLLSCSHVFHETCIKSFEQYNCETVHLCPVCRTMYHKTRFGV